MLDFTQILKTAAAAKRSLSESDDNFHLNVWGLKLSGRCDLQPVR